MIKLRADLTNQGYEILSIILEEYMEDNQGYLDYDEREEAEELIDKVLGNVQSDTIILNRKLLLL